MINERKAQEEMDFDKFAFYFCLIDILFLPYAFFMAISYSIVVLFIWILRRYDMLIEKKEFNWYLIFSCVVVFGISVLQRIFKMSFLLSI